jgi:Dyp-type peroxidase family
MKEDDKEGCYTEKIQGNILRGFHYPEVYFVFVEFTSAEAGRQWVDELRPDVTHGGIWQKKPQLALNVAFTFRGLTTLRVRRPILERFDPAFCAGMQQRRAETRDGDDKEWDPIFTDGSIDALVMLHGKECGVLDKKVKELCLHPAIKRYHVQKAARLPHDREHFGFRDGISQPIQQDPLDEKRWTSDVPIKEFLIFPSRWNGDRSKQDADGLALAELGTYLVLRKLQQHVDEFEHFKQGWPVHPDLVGAKLIGRWPNGTPVTPNYLPFAERQNDDDTNDFDFSDDPEGLKCPYGAHISRVNPRSRVRADDHRILRRGVPYVAPVGEKSGKLDPNGDERGLVFVALNASIENQFEFVQRAWVNERSFNRSDGMDPFAHSVDGDLGNFRFHRGGPSEKLESFVTLRGGEYFFVPSMSALEGLANGLFSIV